MYEKIVQTGDLIEIYTYEKQPAVRRNGIISTYKRKRAVERRQRVPSVRYRTKRSLYRAMVNFMRVVRSSLWQLGAPSFLTLTMRDLVDLEHANRELSMFFQKLKRRHKAVKYVCVPEWQKRGAVHYHALVWGLPMEMACVPSKQFYRDSIGKLKRKHICEDGYGCERQTRVLSHLWGLGFVDLFQTDGSYKISGYLAKYMYKTMADKRLAGKKAYSCSRGLIRPVVLNTIGSVDIFKEIWEISDDVVVPDLTFIESRVYSTEWLGRANYRSYSSDKNYESHCN